MFYFQYPPAELRLNLPKAPLSEAFLPQDQAVQATTPSRFVPIGGKISVTTPFFSGFPPAFSPRLPSFSSLSSSPFSLLGGIPVLYAGFVDFSNSDGLVQFPLRHEAPKVYVVITPSISVKPVEDAKKTLSHLEFMPQLSKELCEVYLYEVIQGAEKKEMWKVSKLPSLPPDNRISMISLIILTNPYNLGIVPGVYEKDEKNHYVLPSMYIVARREREKTESEVLSILPYFEPIDEEKTLPTKEIVQTVLQNG